MSGPLAKAMARWAEARRTAEWCAKRDAPERTWPCFICTKRVEHAEAELHRLREEGEDAP